MVPWGTPHVNEQLLESDPFTDHFCVRFSKYDWNHLKDLPWQLITDCYVKTIWDDYQSLLRNLSTLMFNSLTLCNIFEAFHSFFPTASLLSKAQYRMEMIFNYLYADEDKRKAMIKKIVTKGKTFIWTYINYYLLKNGFTSLFHLLSVCVTIKWNIFWQKFPKLEAEVQK